jgi:hypothetical protein
MKNRAAYTTINKISALALICTLLWLTVSLPFVYRSQLAEQHKTATSASAPFAGSEEDSSNPLSGTEEKAPSTTNLAEEFLHDHEKADSPVTGISADHYHQNDGTYQAFHGELLVPPPNAA